MAIKDLVEELWPLSRDLVSDGFDEALGVVRSHLPEGIEYAEEIWQPGARVWTWRVPERYRINAGYLETEDGERLIDVANHRLHVFSYSLPVDEWLTWEELEPHLHYVEHRPDAIPWRFTYYERRWGFCLSKRQFDALPRDARYHAVIDVEYDDSAGAGMRLGVATVHPPAANGSMGEFVVCSHVDHPSQANDDAAGVAVAAEVARRLTAEPLPDGSMSVKFLFIPETIGSIAYLSRHEDEIPRLNAGMFIDMAGNRSRIALQRSRQDAHLIDRIAAHVLAKMGVEHVADRFRQVVGNDEIVMNGPGVNIPTISLSRSCTTGEYEHFPEYHTSDDVPDIVGEERLAEMADVVEEIVRIYASNFVPVRQFRGPLFLSGHGLWVDWRDSTTPLGSGQDNAILEVEQIMTSFEGDRTVFDIAEALDADYWVMRKYVSLYVEKGLVLKAPVPREPFGD